MLSWLGTRDVNQLIAKGNYPKAIKILEGQLKQDPDSVHLRQQLADVLVRDGRKRRAIEILESLVHEYAEEGFLTKAIAVLKKVQRIDPEQSDAELMLDTLVKMNALGRPPSKIDIPSIPSISPPPAASGIEEVDAFRT